MIAVGSVVWLRSGGPAMTVTKILGDLAVVAWFGGFSQQDLKYDAFDLKLLTAINPQVVTRASDGATVLQIVPRDEPA